MSSTDVWQVAYMIALFRGSTPPEAKNIAYQAVDDWEEFELDTD